MSGLAASPLVQWLRQTPLAKRSIQVRGKTFIPQDYDVFAGLDVDKRSLWVTFSNHQGVIRSLRLPYGLSLW